MIAKGGSRLPFTDNASTAATITPTSATSFEIFVYSLYEMREQTRTELCLLGTVLAVADKHPIYSNGWVVDVPDEPGVYAIWDNAPVYVGQTSGLKPRLRNLRHSKTDPFRRKVALALSVVEASLTREMALRYSVSYIKVEFGRVELEEFLSLRWRETLFDSPSKRLLRGSLYDWVKPHHCSFLTPQWSYRA